MTFDEAINLFLEEGKARQLAPKTLKEYAQFSQHFVDWYPNDDAREVTQKDLLDFHIHLQRRKKSPANVNRHSRVIRRLFHFLYKREFVLSDITLGLPTLHNPERLPRNILNAGQVMKLLKSCHMSRTTGFRDRTMFELLYSTGLRGEELCRLKLYDLNLPDRTLRVVQGKGKKDRVVPIGKVACAYLTEYLKNVRPLLMKGKEDPALFVTWCGTPLSTKVLRQQFVLQRDRAHLPDSIGVHSLRHSCATEMLKGGASLRHVQELLGHARINTTQIYTHVLQDDLKAVHAKTAPSERRKFTGRIHFELEGARWRTSSGEFTKPKE